MCRSTFTTNQIEEVQAYYNTNKYITKEEIEEKKLCEKWNMSFKQIKNWFKNRRYFEKVQKIISQSDNKIDLVNETPEKNNEVIQSGKEIEPNLKNENNIETYDLKREIQTLPNNTSMICPELQNRNSENITNNQYVPNIKNTLKLDKESEMETELRIDNPRNIKKKSGQNCNIDIAPDAKTKTKVQIKINGAQVYWIKIQKRPNTVTLADIKNQLMQKQRIYGIVDVKMYDYFVKTTKNDQVGLEEIDEDASILPLFVVLPR